MPEVLVTGGSGGALDGLAATLINMFRPAEDDAAPAVPEPAPLTRRIG